MFGGLFDRRALSFGVLIAAFLAAVQAPPARADIGSWIVIDADSGQVLDEFQGTRRWYPASLTKMMTAYVTLKAIREGRSSLDSAVTQSQNSLAQPPSKMGFKVGTQMTVDTALKIVMVKSANDIAVALGEAIGGTEANFVALMNAEAARLGMRDTHFANPHGLPDNRQVSSALDMAILARALRRDFPEARGYYGHAGLTFGKQTLRSANREFLLRVPGADGMKTGYICNSGYNVAASATRRGRTVIAVVLGASSGLERTAFAREAIDKGFRARGSGRTVDNMPRSAGQPPEDAYCKRNPKPGPEEILARYDIEAGGGMRASTLSFFAPGEGRPLIPGAAAPAVNDPSEDADDDIKTGSGKVDWGKVLDRTVGVQQVAYAPVPVHVGLPKGAGAPAKAITLAPGVVVPLPPSKPLDLRPAAMVAPSETGNAGFVPAAPGSIFRAATDSGAPVPRPSPNR
ncbi:D-alanyl-D-alanine carboxypeptidase family protein [Polymorphum gilvum]|uniref:D-alanyl-D-alanine carboxypeptidase family n=1 Tax=Polymorphum gilvum (strain LMG 25793 / CGMCC 1.9160 / SL003B-26A1) TaxID=991905 RepID=F2IZC4_POLGS|nr:D-alanyl-D-alanine carboxypeptidase family protein [Polymorphum gilvum]ADZ68547.1 D-alanyl-D-alanine carboxypeptidase family [Polymorphum gilvum SL003B-26A1]